MAAPSPPHLKILVAYVTRSGYTRLVAREIATRLRRGGHDVDLADLELCIRHPEQYDVIVLGSAVRFHHHAEVVANFIVENREILSARRTAFFSVDRRAFRSRDADPGGHMERLFERVGWRPQVAVAVAGKLDYREHTWPRRIFMRAASRHRGAPTDTSRDHDLTDWGRVASFTDALTQSPPTTGA